MFFSQKTGFDISCKLSNKVGDGLHEMSNTVSGFKKSSNCRLLNFTQKVTTVKIIKLEIIS